MLSPEMMMSPKLNLWNYRICSDIQNEHDKKAYFLKKQYFHAVSEGDINNVMPCCMMLYKVVVNMTTSQQSITVLISQSQFVSMCWFVTSHFYYLFIYQFESFFCNTYLSFISVYNLITQQTYILFAAFMQKPDGMCINHIY